MTVNVESGLRGARTQFIAEAVYGTPPTNPAWELFSDNVFSVQWAGSADVFAKRGLGTVDPDAFFTGPESHSLTTQHYLQRWLVSGGVPVDPLGYAVVRDADNNLYSSIHIVHREERSTSGGILSSGVRTYLVAQGCYADQTTLPGQLETGEPILANIVWMAEKVREYRIDQPASATAVTVESTSASDTTQTVTIEDEDAGTTSALALNGTTPVSSGATTFADIDAIRLDATTVGDVIVKKDGTGEVLCTIRGGNYYASGEGDLGVPLLGSGSNAAAIGTAYEQFIGDTVTWAAGALAQYVNSVEFRISNNIEAFPQTGTARKILIPGIRTCELDANLFGENESHRQMDRHFGGVLADIVWTLTGGTITLDNAILRDPPEPQWQAQEVSMQMGVTFESQGVTVA